MRNDPRIHTISGRCVYGPLGVTLHAVARAGAALGRKVLVTGPGPIGVLVAASVRLAGAAEIVVTDLYDEALPIAGRMGATDTVNVRTSEAALTFELASDRSKAMKVSLVARE